MKGVATVTKPWFSSGTAFALGSLSLRSAFAQPSLPYLAGQLSGACAVAKNKGAWPKVRPGTADRHEGNRLRQPGGPCHCSRGPDTASGPLRKTQVHGFASPSFGGFAILGLKDVKELSTCESLPLCLKGLSRAPELTIVLDPS